MKEKTLSCFFSSPPPQSSGWTVGELRDLECESEQPLSLPSKASLKIEFKDKSFEHTLAVVRTEKITNKKIYLKVTGYKPGEYKNTSFTIKNSGGEGESFLVDNLSWSTASVLKPEAEVKPYPSYGPWAFSFPVWYLFAWGGLLIILALLAGAGGLKHLRRKKILSRVRERLEGGKTPVQHFIEAVQPFFIKRGEALKSPLFFQETELALREFLENKFLIPLEAPRFKAVKKLRRQKIKEEKVKALFQIFMEFEKISSSEKIKSTDGDENSAPPEGGSVEDKEQILDMVRDFVFEWEK